MRATFSATCAGVAGPVGLICIPLRTVLRFILPVFAFGIRLKLSGFCVTFGAFSLPLILLNCSSMPPHREVYANLELLSDSLVAHRFNRGPQRAMLEWGEQRPWSPADLVERYRLCDSSAECECKGTKRIMVFVNFSRKKIKKSEKLGPLSHFHTFTLFEQRKCPKKNNTYIYLLAELKKSVL